jgi:hypothetical protein
MVVLKDEERKQIREKARLWGEWAVYVVKGRLAQ